jgi:hypothetical protein
VQRVSTLRWLEGWKAHRMLFPDSSVRFRLVVSLAVTIGFALVAFFIEARHLAERLPPR